MATTDWVCVDGNEAAARVAHRLSEVIAIYPITPATPMGELADAWSAIGQPNLWGQVPRVLELQSEAGAVGTLHGALLKGALATTFTASQGLLLMLPNMFKIAGELTPAVIHVAARTVATHALSIFGDHSDVMAARITGWAMLASASVQETHDLALVAHAATLASRVPFLHFFDGFRTSHEVAKIRPLTDDDLGALVDLEDVGAHRERGLSPDRPRLRGSAQNPDVFFQAREAVNPFYAAVPGIVQATMDRLAERIGRRYRLVDYQGHPEAERVVLLMGSGAGAAAEAVEAMNAAGGRVGLVTVRLYRPFPAEALLAALPGTVRRVAVLDRTKEPGATGEPLYQDVVTALAEHAAATGTTPPLVVGGRYGLASKEFTPAMTKAVLDGLAGDRPRNHFTVGIADDVSHTSLVVDGSFQTEDPDGLRAVFYGLGSDGTVSANKTAVKIIGEGTDLFAQGYFVYDSKKSGSVTVSHLRVSRRPIRSAYLIERANFVACHQFGFLERMDVLERAAPGATFLLNSPWSAEEVWDHLPVEVQRDILDKQLDVWVVDAARVAREAGLGHRVNTVMQPCFFALAGVLPRDEALAAIKRWVEKAFSRRGEEVVARNFAAVDHAVAALSRVQVPAGATATHGRRPAVPAEAPDFVRRVTARMLEGRGDLLPVSALPVDGAFPTGTAQWEKRSLAAEIPIWDPSICIDCGKCAIVCPHATIRMKVFGPDALDGAPEGFDSKDFRSRDLPGHKLTVQVAPDDCTGCGVCVEVCPAHSKDEVKHKAINMTPIDAYLERERARWDYFLEIPELDHGALPPDSVKGSQVRRPLFEFSGACAGCGETPYLKLISQLFGDRLLVANATGCSSIYGGNLPTTPWATNAGGRGPAWANSLFEDNAEFGLGIRLAADSLNQRARQLVGRLGSALGGDLTAEILDAVQDGEATVAAQRGRVAELRRRLADLDVPQARELEGIADELVRRSVWIVGGDGWAYDIGSGGLDAVLASGQDVNVLVLDTEVYSNTGGQASKATPRGAVAKFAARGKQTGKKDLGMIAMAYGNVYVAHVALGASDMQTVKALLEAEAWPGPSLVIAYSTCIAHGFDMSGSMAHQRDAARSGHWPLYRYHPDAERPFQLDSKPPTLPLRQFAETEARFGILARTDPGEFDHLMTIAEEDTRERWRYYEQLATLPRTAPHLPPRPDRAAGHADEEAPVTDLRTRYLGLELRSPLVASASPLTGDPDDLRRLEDAGVAAAVLPSLFEEQLTHDQVELDRLLEQTSDHVGEALSYFPDLDDYNTGPTSYLELIQQAKRAVAIPVIASLNGTTPGGWVRHARRMQDAGADAIELNLYGVATDPTVGAAELEVRYLEVVAEVRSAVTVPLAVKLSPFFTAMANMAIRVADAGADGLVLFNRFYQPDLDLDTLDVVPRLVLSTSEELRLPLRWIAILYGQVPASLAATTGVHTGLDAAKVLLAGADVAMMTSALLRHGPDHVREVERELVAILDERGYASITQLRGSMSRRSMPDPAGFERANYARTLASWSSRTTPTPGQADTRADRLP